MSYDVGQMHQILTEILELSRQINVELGKAGGMKQELTSINELWTTYLSLVRQAGLPEDVMQLMSRIQQMRVTAQAAIKTFQLFQAALVGTGPIGWLLFLGSAGLTGLMLADQMEMRKARY